MKGLSLVATFLLVGGSVPVGAQTCTHPLDPGFYQAGGYKVGRILIESPFDFFFLVRQRFEAIKAGLPLKENEAFEVIPYNQSFDIVQEAVTADSAFGSQPPVKIVVVRSGLLNCQETGNNLSVDVVYRVFSSDPIPAAQATPEEKEHTLTDQATAVARKNLVPRYTFRPFVLFDATRRGFGGADFSVAMPGRFIRDFQGSAAGSSSSKAFKGEFNGEKDFSRTLLDHAEYHGSYQYSDIPASALRLAGGKVQARFEGSSKPLEITRARILFRYGTSIEQGNQQSNLGPNTPSNVFGNSRFGALRFYAGGTSTTRRSELAVSYGLEIAGAGLGNLNYQKQIGDVSYGIRFPGHSHSPWDITARATAGAITGSGPTLVNDRFFGGNSVSQFIQGDRWSIQNGPLIRSIPTNRLTGDGLGGTSFFSTNLTIGKVLFASPIIPPEVENAPGFGDAIGAAENSAQNWFADDYEAASPEFKAILKDFPDRLQTDLNTAQAAFKSIRDAGAVAGDLNAPLTDGERQARLAQNLIRNVSGPGRGSDNAIKLRAWSLPSSRFVMLVTALNRMEPLVAAPMKSQLQALANSITGNLTALSGAINAVHTGSARQAAEARAKNDMARPREVIDTLRFEANRFALGAVGIFDVARLRPDPFGTRYAIGGGVRLSIVNVNFTLGYAFNPSPRQELGQGRGALFFSLSYTNLF